MNCQIAVKTIKLEIIDNLPERLRNNIFSQNLTSGQRLFRKGDRADYLYLIKQGRFQEISYTNNQKMAVIQILNYGDTLGETSLLFNNYRSSAIAQTDSQVMAFPKSVLLKSTGQYLLLIEAIIELLYQKIYG